MIRKLGMFSPEIKRDTVDRLFDAARLYGFEEMQFDFLSVCDEEMPACIDDGLVKNIRSSADAHGIVIRAVNGTFNMAHPDPSIVEDGITRFAEIARICRKLGCGMVTLCTGTRNVDSMWRYHPYNETPEAWKDMLRTAERLKEIAEQYDVVLGIETEASNVVNTPEHARRLLDAMKSDRFGMICDPANLFHIGMAHPDRAISILEHAFEMLKENIILAHAKDIRAGDGISFTSAGRGIVPFERFFELLDKAGYCGGIVAHGIHDELEFPYSVSFLKSLM